MTRRQAARLVKHADQVRALGSPTRIQVYRSIEELGPCTVSQVAAHLGRSASSLYYHVHALVDADLIEEAGAEQGPRRPRKLYRTVARALKFDLGNASPEYREAIADTVGASLRMVDRQHRRAIEGDIARLSGPDRERSAYHMHVRLNRASVRELNRRIGELKDWAYEMDRQGPGRFYSVMVVLAPCNEDA